MSRHRFFLAAPLRRPGEEPHPLPLSADDAHHAMHVLRVRPGEEIEAVEPDASVWRVRITGHQAGQLRGVAVERLPDTPPGPDVVLVQGVTKGERMDEVVRHAVEVGATEIVPFLAARTVVKLDARKRASRGERWRRVAKSAAEQAHRNRIPRVHDPVSTSGLPGLLSGFDRVVVLWEEASAQGQGIAEALAPVRGREGTRVALVVGPEGGLTADEVELFADAGAVTATLGDNVLRAQTAALIGLGLVVHELGGLGGRR